MPYPISNSPTGVQTVVLIFKNPAGGRVADFDWFRLLATPAHITYYVSTLGIDTNDGKTLNTPFRSIAKAVKSVLPGDTVDIRAGIYNEAINFSASFSGTATDRITIQAHPGETVTIDGAGITLSTKTAPLVNSRADYVTYNGLEIRNSAGRGISGDGDFVTLQNLKIHTNQDDAIALFDEEGAQVLNTEFWDNVRNNLPLGSNTSGGWGAGMITFQVYNNVISGNNSHNNNGEGIIIAKDSFYTTVTGNTSRDNWSVGIYLDGAHYTTVERNLVYNTQTAYIANSSTTARSLMTAYATTDEDYSYWGAAGAWGCGAPGFTPGSNNTWRNNIAVNTRYGFAYSVPQISCSGLKNDVIENNTFVGTWLEPVRIAPGGAHSNTVFRNNIFEVKGSADGHRVLTAQDRNDTTFESNLFWSDSGTSAYDFLWRTDEAWDPITDFPTFATSDHLTNNQWGNPNLVALGSLVNDIAGNEKLTATSLVAIGKGSANGAPTNDFWMTARQSPIDIGAHQFNGIIAQPTATNVPPSNTPLPTATNVPPTNTSIPPTATNTVAVPTNTPMPTSVPPTKTFVPPTVTTVPATNVPATNVPTTSVPATNVPAASKTNTPVPTSVPPTATFVPPTATVKPTTGVAAYKVQYYTGAATSTTSDLNAYIKIFNNTGNPVALSQFKVRYWFTRDSSLTPVFGCYYAVINCANVTGTITVLSTARPNADAYMEISFTAAAGSIPAYDNPGDVLVSFHRSDWSNFTQTNDYSYNSAMTSYADASKITLYQNGTLIWGVEPGTAPTATNVPPTNIPAPTKTNTPVPTNTSIPPTATKVPPTNTPAPTKTNAPASTNTSVPPTATKIPATNTPAPQVPVAVSYKVQYYTGAASASVDDLNAYIKIFNNTGSAVALSQFKVRYWFTRDTTQPFVYQCYYANINCSNVTGTITVLSTARTNADAYMEVGFTSAAGSITAGGNTSDILVSFHRSDWNNFTQTNDYSFTSTMTSYADAPHITLYQNGKLVWGQEP